MPNGRTSSLLIGREQLAGMLQRMAEGSSGVGPSTRVGLRISPQGQAVDLGEVVRLLGLFRGAGVWIEEHGEAMYVMHLDHELEAREPVDSDRWIVVRPDSPLFEPLRLEHARSRTWSRCWDDPRIRRASHPATGEDRPPNPDARGPAHRSP